MPDVRWYLQKKGSGALPMFTVTVMVCPARTSSSIPSDWIVTLCNAVPVFRTVSVRVPADTSVTHVGAKKKSPAWMGTLEPLAATAPWSLTGVGRAVDAGQVADDPAPLGDAAAGAAEPLLPEPPQTTPVKTNAAASATPRAIVVIRWSP
jgi:hypothetical protein